MVNQEALESLLLRNGVFSCVLTEAVSLLVIESLGFLKKLLFCFY